MSNRPKIILTFILGTLNPYQEVPDWYLKIDRRNDALVEQLQMKSFAWLLFRSAGHIEKDDFLAYCYFRANEKNAIAIMRGERDGWIAQRTGGMCTKPAKVFETRSVEIEFPRVMDDPYHVLMEVWPAIPENAEETLKGARYTQWPGGQHWYVRLANGLDVEVDGKMKWDTYDEAVAATKRFIAGCKT